MKKIYVIRKYIVASSAKEVIKKEYKHPVDDVFIDDTTSLKEVLFEQTNGKKDNIGFKK